MGHHDSPRASPVLRAAEGPPQAGVQCAAAKPPPPPPPLSVPICFASSGSRHWAAGITSNDIVVYCLYVSVTQQELRDAADKALKSVNLFNNNVGNKKVTTDLGAPPFPPGA